MQFIKELWIKNYIIFCLFLIFMLIGIYIWVVYPKGGELLDIALYRNDFLDGLFPLITLMGEAYVYVLAALIAIIYNNKICFIFVSILGTVAALSSYVLKNTFGLPRPKVYFIDIMNREDLVSYVPSVELANSFVSSFPSGHTLAAFAFYMFFILETNSYSIKVVLFIIALLVGFSRLYLFQHFIADVVAGGIIGTIWAIFFYYFYQKAKQKELNFV